MAKVKISFDDNKLNEVTFDITDYEARALFEKLLSKHYFNDQTYEEVMKRFVNSVK